MTPEKEAEVIERALRKASESAGTWRSITPRAVLAAACVIGALVYFAWLCRYEIVAVGGGGEYVQSRAWQLDRWTGRTRMLLPSGEAADWQ